LDVFIVPPSIAQNKNANRIYRKLLRTVLDTYQKLISDYKIPKEDARFVLPNATSTKIAVTGNMSAWMHFLKMRLDPSAQWEIRELAVKILIMLHKKCPNIFDEMYVAYVSPEVEVANV
jgi:thymidylate synthase (FAD)